MTAHWTTKSLGDICDILDSKRKPVTKSDRKPGPFPYYGATGILDYVADYIFDEKLVLIGEDGAKWAAGENTAFIADGQYWVNNHAHVIRPRRSIVLDEWIVYYINANDQAPFITGLTVPKLNQAKLCEIPVPLPPLAEQKRIVAILDEAFAGIAAATANAEKNLANARELFENYLNSVFTGGIGWTQKKLGDRNFLQIIDGDRGANYPNKSEFSEQGHCLFLNTKNVRPDGFSFERTMFISQEKDDKLRNGKLRRRDVVLTTRGTIGNVALYDDSVGYKNIRINSGMLIFRPNERLLLSEFLFEIFRSGIMKNQINKFVTGTAQPQLPIQTLVNFVIPVPDNLDDQRQIVTNLRTLFNKAQCLEDIYQRKLGALAELKQSILRQAFSGELTALPGAEMQEEAA